MFEKTKDVEISGKHYRLGRFTAQDGSFILQQLMAASFKGVDFSALPTPPPDATEPEPDTTSPEDKVRRLLMGLQLRGGLDYDAHCFIQRKCLAVCSRLEEHEGAAAIAIRISTADGVVLPDIANDMPLVMRIEMETLVFNLSSFFAAGGMSALAGDRPPKA
jgi:hypothetical protein